MTFVLKSKHVNGYYITAEADRTSHYVEVSDEYGRTVSRRYYSKEKLDRGFKYHVNKYSKEA